MRHALTAAHVANALVRARDTSIDGPLINRAYLEALGFDGRLEAWRASAGGPMEGL